MKENFLAVIDSGSGGLSVWQAIVALLPQESIIYVGDHAHLPYSEKSTTYIRERILGILRFLQKQKVKLVVIACNTATVAGIEVYRRYFPKLPIVGVVPVVKTAAEISQKRKFAIISTKYTAASSYQHDLIEKFAGDCRVINLGCPNLVSAVENGDIRGSKIRRQLKKVLSVLKNTGIDCLALGCTHYPFLSPIIHDIVGGDVRLLDSGGAVARHVHRILEQNRSLKRNGKPVYHFLTTGRVEKVTRVARKLLGRKIEFKKVQI